MFLSIFLAISAGLIIELFFRAIKFNSEESNKYPIPKYRPFNNYITVLEYVSGGNTRWINYVIFRTFPPFIIISLFGAIYQKYSISSNYIFLFLISIFISTLPRDIKQLSKHEVTLSEKIMHILNLIVLTMLAIILGYLLSIVNIAFLAPSLEGIIDNLWASLFAALLIIFYLDTTNINKHFKNEEESRIKLANYVVNSLTQIENKFGSIIDKYCLRNHCSKTLLYSILIYENLNRPILVRMIENVFVKLTKKTMTVGIAQVKSSKPLTDEKSIEVASVKLKNTDHIIKKDMTVENMQLLAIIQSYNESIQYSDSILRILNVMKVYAPKLFV